MDKIAQFAIDNKNDDIDKLIKKNLIVKPYKPFYWSFTETYNQKTLLRNFKMQIK